MITITNECKTIELDPGCVLYTEDGETFTQVETATNLILSATVPGDERWKALFLSVATWGPVPDGARFENMWDGRAL